jgi:hypothetical protein
VPLTSLSNSDFQSSKMMSHLNHLFWISSIWLKNKVFKVMCSLKILLAMRLES